jgi:signal transduction histidine kinase
MLTATDIAAAALYLLPALVWAIVTRQMLAFLAANRTRSRLFRLMPVVGAILTAHFVLLALLSVSLCRQAPDAMSIVARPAYCIREISWIVALAILRHLLQLAPLPERPPSRAWLLVNYGLASLFVAADLALRLSSAAVAERQMLGHRMFELGFTTLGALSLRQLLRVARPGAWGPEGAGELRRPDLILIGVGVGTAFASYPLLAPLDGGKTAMVVLEIVLGLTFAAPFAMRMLGVVLPELVVAIGSLVVVAALLAAFVAAGGSLAPRAAPALDLALLLVLGLCLGPFQTWLRVVVSGAVLRQRQSQQENLQRFLYTLSPELGVATCCRLALRELVRVRPLRGAAILLRSGEAIVEGEIDLEPVVRVWPRGDGIEALPAQGFGSAELRELPLTLREALIEANVGLGARTISSPRRRWGHLFMNTGLLGGTFREDDVQTIAGFVGQLALLLDSAELLHRALEVERSLAHAEKLAAIGELAARVAHEIRNPVTAARSLTQLIAREPASSQNDEHAHLILTELGRVERQVADLLRFARRDDLRFEPVDLGRLACETLDGFRQRFAGDGVELSLDAPEGVYASADRERLRQVLINLVENAVDALADRPAGRRLAVRVGARNGRVTLRVADNGPGVPPDVHARLFEPFFSSKENGTGLGLAIAKRTIDAHGGTIEAEALGAGLAFQIELPALRASAAPAAATGERA